VRFRSPAWLWPNLLSLDAPAVAVAWQVGFARSFQVHVPWPATLLLGLCVWLIYVADRLLDAIGVESYTARHVFYRSYFPLILPGLVLGMWGAIVLLLPRVDAGVRSAGVNMTGAMALYFILVHAAPRRWKRYWPKELAVAVLFALGTCLPVYAEVPSDWRALLPPVTLFASLCWINAVAIDRWEREQSPPWLVPLSLAASGLALALAFSGHPLLYCASALAGVSLAWLSRQRQMFQPDQLRVLADAVLAVPPLLLLLR